MHFTVDKLRLEVQQRGVLMPPRKVVTDYLKKDLNFSYRRCRHIYSRANAAPVKVLRQMCAQKLLSINLHDKILVNVDESSFEKAYYIRKAWMQKHKSNNFSN